MRCQRKVVHRVSEIRRLTNAAMQCTAGSRQVYRLGVLHCCQFAKWKIACSFCRIVDRSAKWSIRQSGPSTSTCSRLHAHIDVHGREREHEQRCPESAEIHEKHGTCTGSRASGLYARGATLL
eukprot:2035550-Pleurochrysis_carterae.AAC.1